MVQISNQQREDSKKQQMTVLTRNLRETPLISQKISLFDFNIICKSLM